MASFVRRGIYGPRSMGAPAVDAEIHHALHDEYRALATAITAGRDRAERLQALAERARAQAEQDERALHELAGLLGMECQLCLESLDERLRGQRLQEIAMKVLGESEHPAGEPVHYREWYRLLRAAGYAVGGKDPLATFLASVGRSPRVRSVGRRTGLYVVADASGDR